MKRKLFALLMLTLMVVTLALPVYVLADTANDANTETAVTQEAETTADPEAADKALLGDKAIACGIAISFAAGLGALGMGIATGKSVEGISRQPEVENKIRTTFMLGIVFMETAIIYALLVVILVIFVL